MSAITDISSNLQGQMLLHTVRVVKGDTDRVLRISLSNGGTPYEISQDAYAVLMGRKPDGSAVYNNCRIENNRILYEFTDQTCAAEGSYPVQVRLYGPDQKILTTVPIQIDVYPTAFDAEAAAASADEQTALDDLVNRSRALQLEILHDRDTDAYQGESAYEIAQRLGFQGTEQQWADSLRYDHSEEFSALAAQVRQAAEASAGYVAAAENARNQAAGSAETAAAQAGEASRQAGLAKDQASAAGNHAAAASEFAGQAKTHAQTASGAAETATAQAQTAGKEADRAKKEADNAAQAALDAQTILDDSVISEQKTRSSLKLYDTICPAFEETGPVVTCHPVADYPIHVVSKIDAKQEGSGDPRPPMADGPDDPGNIRPVKPVSDATLSLYRKNLVKGVVNGYPLVYGNRRWITHNGGVSAIIDVSRLAGKTLTASCTGGNTFIGVYMDSDEQPIAGAPIGDTLFEKGDVTYSSLTFKLPDILPAEYLAVAFTKGPDARPENFQIEVSSTATDYEPYKGRTYTADLPAEVYGGSMNWQTGEVTPNIRKLTAKDVFKRSQGNYEQCYGIFLGFHNESFAPGGFQACNVLVNQTKYGCTGIDHFYFSEARGIQIFINPKRLEDVGAVDGMDWLKKAGVEFWFETKDFPAEKTAEPVKIPALPGENNLYSSTGDTTVSGREDPIFNSRKKDERITALENLITEKLGGM